MSAPLHAESGAGRSRTVSNWTCPADQIETLSAALDQFLDHPADAAAADLVVHAIREIASAGPGGAPMLERVRQQRWKRDGGFSRRYVALKWLDKKGRLTLLKQQVPARDRIPEQMAAIIDRNSEHFPEGAGRFFEQERPLLQAPTGEFEAVVAEQIRREIAAPGTDRFAVSHQRLASLVDLSQALHHQGRIHDSAHPAALQKIDAADVSSICDFLTAVAGRLPLSTAEFDQFLKLVRTDWDGASDKDVVLRGRIITVGLDGKGPLLQSWVAPFVHELVMRGLLPRVSGQYQAARRAAKAAEVIRPRGASTAGVSVLDHDTQEMAACDTSIQILEGVPEPERLYILRNYLRCATFCSVVSLDEALHIAQARPDVPGHRQYVIRLFHDEGWIMSQRGRGETIFEKRRLADKSGQTTAPR